MLPSFIEITGAVLFGLALIHTFSTPVFERWSHQYPRHAGLLHYLAEVEAVFGCWALLLVVFMAFGQGIGEAVNYLDSRQYTEPLFVFVVMVIAASRPVLYWVGQLSTFVARCLPVNTLVANYFTLLILIPLMGSFITEPAAMTVAALLLRDRLFSLPGLSTRFKYATVAVLFVNISIGGTLTHFAAPPVLMVANAWGFDTPFMLSTFGWKSAVAVVINALVVSLLFFNELSGQRIAVKQNEGVVPLRLILIHLMFLGLVVAFGHHPPVFLGVLLFFIGFTQAYPEHQERLIIKEALLVGFFLAGLIVLGGMQQWWLQGILTELSPAMLFYGALILTAFTDNAAITYLGSLVEGVTQTYQYALVAGAVTGGGLTVVANAPNPAGVAILRSYFEDSTINPFYLALAAAGPTLVATLAFQCL